MSFNPNKPGDNDYVIDLCQDIRNNFNTIQKGDKSFSQDSVNFTNRTQKSLSDPENNGDLQLFSKEDNQGTVQLYVSDSQGNISQLTTKPVYINPVPLSRPKAVLSLPGGLIMEIGVVSNYFQTEWLTFPNFSSIIHIQLTTIRPIGTNARAANIREWDGVSNKFRAIVDDHHAEDGQFTYTLIGYPA